MDAVLNQRIGEAVNADMPTLVMFHSPDNKESVGELPDMERLAIEYGGKAHFFVVDHETSHDLCEKYGVSRYPTFLIFSDGVEAWRTGGAVPREKLDSMIGLAEV